MENGRHLKAGRLSRFYVPLREERRYQKGGKQVVCAVVDI